MLPPPAFFNALSNLSATSACALGTFVLSLYVPQQDWREVPALRRPYQGVSPWRLRLGAILRIPALVLTVVFGLLTVSCAYSFVQEPNGRPATPAELAASLVITGGMQLLVLFLVAMGFVTLRRGRRAAHKLLAQSEGRSSPDSADEVDQSEN